MLENAEEERTYSFGHFSSCMLRSMGKAGMFGAPDVPEYMRSTIADLMAGDVDRVAIIHKGASCGPTEAPVWEDSGPCCLDDLKGAYDTLRGDGPILPPVAIFGPEKTAEIIREVLSAEESSGMSIDEFKAATDRIRKDTPPPNIIFCGSDETADKIREALFIEESTPFLREIVAMPRVDTPVDMVKSSPRDRNKPFCGSSKKRFKQNKRRGK